MNKYSFRTNKHSWVDRISHFKTKAKEELHRCIIQDIVIIAKTNEVGIIVQYRSDKKWKKKTISPLLLASFHLIWLQQIVVSEDDDDDDDDIVDVLKETLPELEIYDKESTSYATLLNNATISVNLLIKLI